MYSIYPFTNQSCLCKNGPDGLNMKIITVLPFKKYYELMEEVGTPWHIYASLVGKGYHKGWWPAVHECTQYTPVAVVTTCCDLVKLFTPTLNGLQYLVCLSKRLLPWTDPYQLEITSSAGSEAVGKPYSLNCTVEVCPGIPSIVWLGPGGREVTTGGGLTVEGPYHGVSPDNNPTFTVVLTFNPLRTSHAGEYNCESEAGIVARRRRKDIDVHSEL